MAVDTATKRASVLAVRGRRVAPVPDGSVAVADRGHLSGVYYLVPTVATDVVTTRLTLVGTSAARLSLSGTPGTRLTLEGSDP